MKVHQVLMGVFLFPPMELILCRSNDVLCGPKTRAGLESMKRCKKHYGAL